MQAAPSNLSSQDIKAYAMHKQKSQVDERAMLSTLKEIYKLICALHSQVDQDMDVS